MSDDRPSTIGDAGRRLWLYPQVVWGRLMRARTVVHWVLFLVLFIAPWIDIGGHPALRLDVVHRRFYVAGMSLFATDASYLLFVFFSVAFAVFFFTALLGRAWCGWACPQTVFLESIIRPIERLIEGGATQQRKLDAAPWTARKVFQKGLKWVTFIVVAGAIATTTVAYFIGREGIFEAQADPFSHPLATGFFVVLSGLLAFDFLWFREQVCLIVCPYGRFQSVLMDGDSLTVAYDVGRGEPRGKKSDPDAADCVDCGACVRVCPTGIDIRDGVQFECVNCVACIDACDDIMGKLGRPLGLIRFASENELAGQPRRRVRPRTIAYGAALVGVMVGLVVTLAHRTDFEVQLNRMPGPPFVVAAQGEVQNMFQLRVTHRAGDDTKLGLAIEAPAGARLISSSEVIAPDAKVTMVPVVVAWDAAVDRETPLMLRVTAPDGQVDHLKASFLAPRSDR